MGEIGSAATMVGGCDGYGTGDGMGVAPNAISHICGEEVHRQQQAVWGRSVERAQRGTYREYEHSALAKSHAGGGAIVRISSGQTGTEGIEKADTPTVTQRREHRAVRAQREPAQRQK